MAQSNVIVKLSLKDAEVVKRGLQQLGAEGEKALKRIDAAGRAPSAGLRALGAASDELKDKLGGLANHAGSVGTSLATLGPRGLAAAAGIGVMAAALAVAINKAREAGEFFARLGDDAERAGTSASKLATLQGVFVANAASADEANTALVRLRATIDDAMSGSEKAQTAFQNVGVSMEWLSRNGGDTVDVLMKIAQHGGLTAGQLNELTGKVGNALVPAMQELAKVGVQSNEEFDALTKQINETKDRIELLDRQMNVLAMGGAKVFLEGVAQMKEGLVDLTGWFLRTAEANAMFWQRLGQASTKDWLWGDPIKDAMNARNEELARLQKQQEDFKAIVAGQVTIEQAVKNAPTSLCRIDQPADTAQAEEAPRAAAKAPEYIDMTTGKATTPTEDQLFFLNAPTKASSLSGPRSLPGGRRRYRGAQHRLDGVAAARLAAIVQPADRTDRAGPRRGDRRARRAGAIRGAARASGVDDPADRQSGHRHRGRSGLPRPPTRPTSRPSSCPIRSRGSGRSRVLGLRGRDHQGREVLRRAERPRRRHSAAADAQRRE